MGQSLKTEQSYISAQVVDYGIYTHYISSLSQVQLATMEVHRRKNSQGQEHWLLLVLDCLARLPQLGRARDRHGDLLGMSVQMEHTCRFSSSYKISCSVLWWTHLESHALV